MSADSTRSGTSSPEERATEARNKVISMSCRVETQAAMIIATALFDLADAVREMHDPHVCTLCQQVV
jgi:hypothetical protein